MDSFQSMLVQTLTFHIIWWKYCHIKSNSNRLRWSNCPHSSSAFWCVKHWFHELDACQRWTLLKWPILITYYFSLQQKLHHLLFNLIWINLKFFYDVLARNQKYSSPLESKRNIIFIYHVKLDGLFYAGRHKEAVWMHKELEGLSEVTEHLGMEGNTEVLGYSISRYKLEFQDVKEYTTALGLSWRRSKYSTQQQW